MASVSLTSAPVNEPVALDDVLQDLSYPPSAALDPATLSVLTGRLTPKITEARIEVENFLRRALITQTWTMLLDGWPGWDTRYNMHYLRPIDLPHPPFQSIQALPAAFGGAVGIGYIDTSGTPQVLQQDTSYGNSEPGFYAYQLDPGGDSAPARIMPAWARPWPPTRRLPNSVTVVYKAGYGDTAASVPVDIQGLIRRVVKALYNNTSVKDVLLDSTTTRRFL